MNKKEIIEKLEKLEDKEILFTVVLHEDGQLFTFDKYPDETFCEVFFNDIYESDDCYCIELTDIEDNQESEIKIY